MLFTGKEEMGCEQEDLVEGHCVELVKIVSHQRKSFKMVIFSFLALLKVTYLLCNILPH